PPPISLAGGDAHPDVDGDGDAEARALLREFERVPRVWVIVFASASDDESQGIYSLCVGDDDNIVLAFQDEREARRYALCLEKQDFPHPTVSQLHTQQLADFCAEGSFRLGFVPAGSLISPPEQSAVDDARKWASSPQHTLDSIRRRLDSLFHDDHPDAAAE
ncbi:unnamed protein product, partial [Agarophyton chilense]